MHKSHSTTFTDAKLPSKFVVLLKEYVITIKNVAFA